MEDKEVIGDLKNCLAELINNIDDARSLARDASLKTIHIEFGKTTAMAWDNVVERAKLERKLLNLVDAALRFTDNHPELIAVKKRLLVGGGSSTSTAIPGVEKVSSTLLRTFDQTAIVEGEQPLAISTPEPSMLSQKSPDQREKALADNIAGKSAIWSVTRKSILTSPLLPTRSFHKIIRFKITYTIGIILFILVYTYVHLILFSAPLLTTNLLSTLPAVMMIVEICAIVLLIAFLIRLLWTYNTRKSSDRRWMLAISLILLVCIPVNLYMSMKFQQKVESTVRSSDSSPYVGLCDGRCSVDVGRLDGSPKGLAAAELKKQYYGAACAYLDLASHEDQTDAEAKIYYEDQCGGRNATPLRCPCINYIAAIALAQEEQQLYATGATYADPATYNNGVSRSILQAVYLQQEAWNKAHSDGPAMYVFVANVGDVSDIQHAQQWQQNVAQQIISLQQTDREHHINGIVGLPQGMDTLMDQLDNNSIPMVSLTPLSNDNSTHYRNLLSVAPTIEIETSAAVQFLTKNIMKNKHTFRIGVFYYRPDTTYHSMAVMFENKLPRDVVWEDQPYEDLPQNTGPSVIHLAVNAARAYDAIFFVGPVNDLLTFVLTLRKTDKTTPVLSSNTAYQLVYNYQPKEVQAALQGLYFTAFAYHDTNDYVSPSQNSMVDKFHEAYDPQSIHVGNIYTYQLPTSDAIVAYDAMGVFTHLIDHYGIQRAIDWSDQQAFLVNNPPVMASGKITFAVTGSSPQMKTVLLLRIGPKGIIYLDKKL